MRTVEIESLAEFDRRVAAGAESARGWHLQSVDLSGRAEPLATLDVTGAVFLGCRFADGSEDDVRRRGGLVFPAVLDVPFDPYRGRLYSPGELYDGLASSYGATPDARIFAWSHGARAIDRTLASALHDHAVDDALEEYVRDRQIVGVMGGHAATRGSADYREAARLGHALGQHLTVATGGGPGAMEAANLGAWLSGHPVGDLEAAIAALSGVPDFAPDTTAWARAAMAVRARFPKGRDSLGVPTWFYGQEPPNVFANHIAKYFANATREDVLLRVCRAGLVFLPGAAGTVQEVFQSACENYYAGPADVAPMVLVGRRQWTEELPVWPLLSRLAAHRVMAPRVHLVDDVGEVLPLLGA
ncbi:MAG: Rossmann fold nucleotide-binding protein [Marmoricola sp.]